MKTLLVVLALSCLTCPAQKPGSRLLLNPQKPYVFLAFDHIGKTRNVEDGESENGLWLRMVNNSRVPILIDTFDPGTGDAGTGVLDQVVVFVSAGPAGIPGPGQEAPGARPPSGYESEVHSTTALLPGRSLLFSVPRDHVSRRWYLRVKFRLELGSTDGAREPYSYVDFMQNDLPPSER